MISRFWITALSRCAVLAWGFAVAPSHGEDCNHNGVDDAVDVAPALDFGVALNYPSAVLARYQAVADLNGDGSSDFATAASNGEFSIAFNRGDGRFAFPVRYPSLGRAAGIAIAPLDLNASMDLVIGDRDHAAVHTYLNDGVGDLSLFQTISYPAGLTVAGVTMADFNGDLAVDLAVLFQTGVVIHFNNISGGFPGMGGALMPVGTSPVAILAAKLDTDVDIDLAVVNSGTNNVSVLLNNGGAFAAAVPYAVGASPSWIAAGLLNADAVLDLAVTNNNDDSVSLLLNLGNGTFGPGTTVNVGDRPRGVAIRDLTGDGINDLAVSNTGHNNVSLLRNNGSAVFTPIGTRVTPRFPVGVDAADIDVDGDGDLIVLTMNAEACVFENDGVGSFPADPMILTSDNGTYAVAAVDLTGDNRPDLAVTDINDHTVRILRNDAPGFTQIDLKAVGNQPGYITYGDFDGANGVDLATANVAGGSVSVLINNGSGTFAMPVAYPIGTEASGVVAVDVDGDGDLDLAATYPGAFDSGCSCYGLGVIVILRNQGNGTFVGASSIPTGAGAGGIAAGRIDNDVIPDLVVVNRSSGDVRVHRGLGGVAFGAGVVYPFGVEPYEAAVGDLNGDGFDDVVAVRVDISNIVDDNTAVFINRGDGTLDPAVYYAANTPPKLAMADLDDDGDLDIVTGNIASDDVSVLPNRGDGSFGPTINLLAGPSIAGVAVADFDGDDKPDIAGAGFSPGHLVILHNDFAPAVSTDCDADDVPDECGPAWSDRAAFVAAILADSQTPAQVCLYDRNGDGDVNGMDVAGFVADATGG